MTRAEYRKTHSWQAAIALGPQLVSLAEDLPVHEQTGLIMQLHALMVELPACVAADLVDDSKTRFSVMYRLWAALELIDRVYPALDTASSRQAMDQLDTRLDGVNFAEMASSQGTSSAPTEEPTPREEALDAHVEAPATPEPAAPAQPEPAPAMTIPIVPEPTAQPQETTPVHVQPDSV